MRRVLTFIAFFVVMVVVLAIVLEPVVVNPMIANLVRRALPFGDQPVSVRVDAGPSLFFGRVDGISIRGGSILLEGATVGAMEITLRDFSVFDRSFSGLDGGVRDVLVTRDDGTAILVDRIRLSGSSARTIATATLNAAETERVLRASLGEVGIVPDAVSLEARGIRVTILGFAINASLEARGGALLIAAADSLPSVRVVAPGADDPWRIDQVTVASSGMTVAATVDAGRLLAR